LKKIISKRARAVKSAESSIRGLDVIEHHTLIITDSGLMTPDEIRRAEEIFREIRRQLEEIEIIITPWDLSL